jgi:hypothetical protein
MSVTAKKPMRVNFEDLKKIAQSFELTHETTDGTFQAFLYSTAVGTSQDASPLPKGRLPVQLEGPQVHASEPSCGLVNFNEQYPYYVIWVQGWDEKHHKTRADYLAIRMGSADSVTPADVEHVYRKWEAYLQGRGAECLAVGWAHLQSMEKLQCWNELKAFMEFSPHL